MSLTPEQVAVAVAKFREKQLERVPTAGRAPAEAALRAIEVHSSDVAAAGTAAVARFASWRAAFGEDPPPVPVGREAGLAAMQGAGDRLVDIRDLELEAARRTWAALAAAGQKALEVGIPILLSLAL